MARERLAPGFGVISEDRLQRLL